MAPTTVPAPVTTEVAIAPTTTEAGVTPAQQARIEAALTTDERPLGGTWLGLSSLALAGLLALFALLLFGAAELRHRILGR